MAPVSSADVPLAIAPWLAEKFSVMAPGVILDPVLLQTLKFAVLVVGYAMMVSIPLVEGEYPVTAVGSALKVQFSVFVLAIPVCALVTTVAHAPDEIALVPRETVPLKPAPPPPPGHPVPPTKQKPPVPSAAFARAVATPVPGVSPLSAVFTPPATRN